MSASNTDKITDVRNAARPNSARVTSGRSAGGATLACDNLSGWPTASKVHFVTYKVDSNSAVVAGSQLDCYGIVSGNNIGSFNVVDGNDSGHAVGDYVEMLPTAAWGQDLADALTTGHTRTGAHVANLPLTTPVIADFTSATHTHANNAGGGQLNAANALSAATLTAAQMKYGMVRQRQGGTTGDATWVTAGTSNTDTSAKDVFMQAGSATSSSSAAVTVTFPVAFTQIPLIFMNVNAGTNGFWAQVDPGVSSTTQFAFTCWSATGTLVNGKTVYWLAIGQ